MTGLPPRPGAGGAAALALLLAACTQAAGGPPSLALDRSTCAHCTMLISEPAYAGAYRTARQEHLFDDLGCLLAALGSEQESAMEIWVHDLESGRWLPAEEAVFVRSPMLSTPMGGGTVALADRAAAERLATESGGRVVEGLAALRRERADAG